MGIPSASVPSLKPPAGDRANAVLTGTFTATGQSSLWMCYGPFNLVIYGANGPNGNWNATIQLERSFDGGTTWIVCGIGGAGQQAVWTSTGTGSDVSVLVGEIEEGVLYRLDVTAYSSGTINYRFSTSGQAAMSLSVGTAL